MSNTFYTDKPMFGLDIGFSSVKVMQVERRGKHHAILGYGVASFTPEAIENGVIIDHEPIAKAVQELFKKGLVGEISTRRVAFSVPAARTFSRVLNLPKLAKTPNKIHASTSPEWTSSQTPRIRRPGSPGSRPRWAE